MLELIGDILARGGGAQCAPEEQQVIVIQHVLGTFAAGVFGENSANAVDILGAPRIGALQNCAQTFFRVDHARIDRDQGVLARKTPFVFVARGMVLATNEVHQVGHIGLIEHSEVGR